MTGALDAFDWRVPVDEPSGALSRGEDIADLIAADEGEADIVVERAEPQEETTAAAQDFERLEAEEVAGPVTEAAPQAPQRDAAKTAADPKTAPSYTSSHAPDDPGPDDDDTLTSSSVRRAG